MNFTLKQYNDALNKIKTLKAICETTIEERDSLRDDVRKLSGEVDAMRKVVEAARTCMRFEVPNTPRKARECIDLVCLIRSQLRFSLDQLDNLDKRDEG